MKKTLIITLILLSGLVLSTSIYAQNYDHILNYSINGTPTHGVKIKTNLPFIPDGGMPTITIKGYNYGNAEPISLTLIYYVWYTPPANNYFHQPRISSSGSYTPPVYLSNEAGKVVIYIDDRSYFQRFTVSAYGQGDNETLAWFQGWTVADEPLAGTHTVEVPYRNRFKGEVFMPGNGLWNGDGNLGIGTTTPTEKLSVNGKIRAKEIKVEAAPWPDYVFKPEHKLSTLPELEQFIKANHHLPEIPSAAEVEKDGINLGEMNAKLLKKIEELTLYIIDLNKIVKDQQVQLTELKIKR